VQAGFTSSTARIEKILGCTIVYGALPVNQLVEIANDAGPDSLMDMSLSSLMGATMVFGQRADLDRLRAARPAPSQDRQQEARKALLAGNGPLHAWLLYGERGRSSEAISHRFFGLPDDPKNHAPQDPSDLKRCLDFLEQTGSAGRIDEMRSVSNEWDSLVDVWGEIVASFRAEEGASAAPRTYELMQSAMRPARRDPIEK